MFNVDQKAKNKTGISQSKNGKISFNKSQKVSNTKDKNTRLLTKPNSTKEEKNTEKKSQSSQRIKLTSKASQN